MTIAGLRRGLSRPLAGVLGLLILWRTAGLIRYGPLQAISRPPANMGATDVRGILHVHSRHSHDGRAELPEIVAAARDSAVEFLVLTEHNNFGIAASGQEGWKEGVLVLSGAEIGTCDELNPSTGICKGGHLLIVGPRELPGEPTRMPAPELARLSTLRGGIAIAAHPTNRRVPWLASDEGLTGTEVASCFSGYQSNHWGSIGLAAAMYPFNPLVAMNSLVDEPAKEMAYFDRIAARRHFVTVAGADAHANIRLGGGWNIPLPSMRSFFRFVSTHLLLDQPLSRDLETDRKTILHAIAAGRSYVAWDWIGDPRGFSFTATHAGRVWPMGATLPILPARLRAEAPLLPGLELLLLRDGEIVARGEGPVLEHDASREGAYRVEAWLETRSPFFSLAKRQPWILSNPIWLGMRFGGIP